jgi:hypothetical protein
MNKTILIIAALVVAFFVFRNTSNKGTDGKPVGDDQRATASVGLAGGVVGGGVTPDNPNPNPGPPAPDEDKYPRKDCPYCKGTGYIIQGDGHKTDCTRCEVKDGPFIQQNFAHILELKNKVNELYKTKQYGIAFAYLHVLRTELNEMNQSDPEVLRWRVRADSAHECITKKISYLDKEEYKVFRESYNSYLSQPKTSSSSCGSTMYGNGGCSSCGGMMYGGGGGCSSCR